MSTVFIPSDALFTLLQMSKGFAIIAGGLFCAVQALSYQGYMKVNYDRLKSDVEVTVKSIISLF